MEVGSPMLVLRSLDSLAAVSVIGLSLLNLLGDISGSLAFVHICVGMSCS